MRSLQPPSTIVTVDAAPARAGRPDFARRIGAAPASASLLPYTHVTDAYAFRDVLDSGELKPTPCRIFGSDLLYLFYGRPAYRAVQQDESNGIDAYWPVCFVLEPAKVRPLRCFPFDSGAFQQRRYDDHVYHRMIKEDFEAGRDADTPTRVVNLFWCDERSYFDADVRRGLAPLEIDALEFEVKAYRDLIASTGRARFDERSSAVEVQLDTTVKLKGNTVAVIMPSDFATRPILERVEELGALALPFSTVNRHGPENMVSQIYAMVRDLLSGSHGKVKFW